MTTSIIKNTKETTPHIHSLTNFVTVNDCANIILSAGGSPSMSLDPREAAEIAGLAKALVINIGTLENEEAMYEAGKHCNQLGIPVILDPVAAGASALRREVCRYMMDHLKFAVIRGNISEIKYLALGTGAKNSVIDASTADMITGENLKGTIEMAKALSLRSGAVIVISGKTDIVTDGKRVAILQNGHEIMTKITGTGCMLTALTGTYCGANPNELYEASVAATAAMGIAGERAYKKMLQAKGGTLSFRTYLVDTIHFLTDEDIEKYAKKEELL